VHNSTGGTCNACHSTSVLAAPGRPRTEFAGQATPAPARSSSRTTAACPPATARCSAVFRACSSAGHRVVPLQELVAWNHTKLVFAAGSIEIPRTPWLLSLSTGRGSHCREFRELCQSQRQYNSGWDQLMLCRTGAGGCWGHMRA
jgi:hypothetical protein